MIYDGRSSIDWFYSGSKSVDEMLGDPALSTIFDAPAVLYDNGCGRVYSWEPLADLAARWCVPNVGEPEDVLAQVIRTMEGDGDIDRVEAKAEQALEGSNPQLTALARMQVATMDLTSDTDDAVASISTLLPDFVPDGHEYKAGDSFAYDGRTWRVAQAHTSQPQWVPGQGTDSLYYEIVIAPDGILVWRQPTGAHDAPGMGVLRHYPDADGPVYESKRDGNISVPGADEWWALVE